MKLSTRLLIFESSPIISHTMADVEKLVAFNDIRAYLSEQDQHDLLLKLGLDNSNLPHRLRGLNVETEFFLIVSSLNSCKHILSFNEGTSILTGSYSPDALLVLSDNSKLFIEIKSKDEFEYKISGGNLQKRIDFAAEFGYKLLFAVRLDGYWGLYTSEYLQSKGGKLKFPHDYENSVFEKILGSKMYIFPAGIKVISHYSFNETALIGIRHFDFGNLFKYSFYFNEKLIFEADNSSPEKQRAATASILLEGLHDAMSIQSQDVVKITDEITQVTEGLVENTFFQEYILTLAHLKHTLNSFGTKHDATTFYKAILESKDDASLQKKYLEATVQMLISQGVPIIVSTAAN